MPRTIAAAVICRAVSAFAMLPECRPRLRLPGNLRSALTLFELRAARRHMRFLDCDSTQQLVCAVVCAKCKHVGCKGECKGTHP